MILVANIQIKILSLSQKQITHLSNVDLKTIQYWREKILGNHSSIDITKQGYKTLFLITPNSASFDNNLSVVTNKEFALEESILEQLKCESISPSSPKKVVNPLSVSIILAGKKTLVISAIKAR